MGLDDRQAHFPPPPSKRARIEHLRISGPVEPSVARTSNGFAPQSANERARGNGMSAGEDFDGPMLTTPATAAQMTSLRNAIRPPHGSFGKRRVRMREA